MKHQLAELIEDLEHAQAELVWNDGSTVPA